MLNKAAMEQSTKSDELKAFIRSNIQQILNGVNNNVMQGKDGIDYLCATIDRLLYIITGLKIEKNSKSPFGDFQRKNGCQVQKCSHQVSQ